MNKYILHLSDLHVIENLKGNKVDGKFITTIDNDGKVDDYIDRFCEYVKNEYKEATFYLIISGDIADKSKESEYKKAKECIDKILIELSILNDKILIVPGDHDVNRLLCEEAYRKEKEAGGSKEAFEFHQEKLENYGKLHKHYYSEAFPSEKAILKTLILEDEELIFIGINSNFKIDYEGGNGYISPTELEADLKLIPSKYSRFSKIAVFHHNMFSNYENKRTGQWDIANRQRIISLLQKFDFKCTLTGNEHTAGSGDCNYKNEQEGFYYSESGSFSTNSPFPSFKIYEINLNKHKLSLIQSVFQCISNGDQTDFDFGKWHLLRSKDAHELEEFVLRKEPSSDKRLVEEKVIALPESEALVDEDCEIEQDTLIAECKAYENIEIQQELFRIVKNRKLYHSGHFHWSETSRSHNWIDTSKLFQINKDLQFAKKAIIDVIEVCKLRDEFDFIIGLGIEGNMLATRTSILSNKPYSFLPYSYRYDEHSSFERELNFDNMGRFKSVLIITDVVSDGRTIRKLINKREKEFFKDVERITVISLFYTGSKVQSSLQSLNSINVDKFDSNTDHEESRIQFYYVLNLKGEKCSYGSDYREKCLVYKDGLDCVYNFYDDKLALKKKLERVNASK